MIRNDRLAQAARHLSPQRRRINQQMNPGRNKFSVAPGGGKVDRFFRPEGDTMQILNDTEIEQVAGGVIPVVAWKIGAWAVGAVFGAGLVVTVRSLVR
jgi:hypothetical protein